MTDLPSIDLLDDDSLSAFYDAGTRQRGQVYADAGQVTLISSEPGSIQAVCKGSGRATYLVRIHWVARNGFVDLDDTCSCPIGRECKHCVAVLLVARRQAIRALAAHADAEAEPEAAWRRILAGLDAEDAGGEPRGATPVALCLAVHHPSLSRYVVNADPHVTIRPLRRGKGGSWVKTGASWRDVDSPDAHELAHVDPRQRSALRAVMASGRIEYYSNSQAVPLSEFGSDLWYQLQRAVETGVALVGDRPDDLVELSAVEGRATIDLTDDGTGAVILSAGFLLGEQPLAVGGEEGGLIGTPPHGLWSVEGNRLLLVPFGAPLHPTVARLAATGAVTVPAEDVDELLDVYQPALARHASIASTDRSVLITTNRFEGIVLTAERTALDVVELRWSARYRRGERTTHRRLGPIGPGDRERAAEAAAVADLPLPTSLLPGLSGPDGSPRDLTVSGPSVVALLAEVLPQLAQTLGIEVELAGDQPTLQEAVDDPLISLTVTDGQERRDGNDWFDLGVDVSVDGQSVDFARLFAALDRDDEVLILPSGTWLRLDRPEFATLRQLIAEARGLADPQGTGVARLNRFQTSWWDELAGLGVVTEQSERWADSVRRLATLTTPEAVPRPAGLEATLRPYQQDGLDWLAFLHRNRLGGILADDMGLGKTVQALALALHVHQDDPGARFLVIAPTSVVENWAREAARFAPGLAVRAIRETATRRGTSLEDEIGGATVVVTSYALFRLEFEAYEQHRWDLLLLDEAQFVKNHQGKTYQCVRRLEAASKIAITGTPIENTLMDLWSLLSITAPGLYPDPKRFSDTYRRPIEDGTAPELLATLRRRIAPLLRRRTKGEVLVELPPKVEQTVEVELSPRHARIYATQLQRQRQKVLGLVGDVRQHRFEILKSLTLLRQLALDPALVDEEHDDVGSAKLDRLLEDLTQVLAEGHRALVFSQFTRYLARVRTRLDAAGIDHAYLDGRTRDRQAVIDRFKGGEAPVFVISLKAGGFGLNLTEADYCFVLDPWWNPASETQAVDRAHRMGQQNPVVVYRYVATGTIEEKVMELKARKADLFTSVLEADGAPAAALDEDDIRDLFGLA